MSPTHSPSTSAAERLFSIACPTCGAMIAVAEEFMGASAECPLCAGGFRLPPAEASPSRPVAAGGSPASTAGPAAQAAGMRPSKRQPSATRQTGAWVGPELEAAGPRPVDDDEKTAVRRTAAERAARRARRNVVMLIAGGSILLGIVMLLGRKRR